MSLGVTKGYTMVVLLWCVLSILDIRKIFLVMDNMNFSSVYRALRIGPHPQTLVRIMSGGVPEYYDKNEGTSDDRPEFRQG